MGEGKFLSEMFDCVASKVGLEPLVSRAGCEPTGTKCLLLGPRFTVKGRVSRGECRGASGGGRDFVPSTLAARHLRLDTPECDRPPQPGGLADGSRWSFKGGPGANDHRKTVERERTPERVPESEACSAHIGIGNDQAHRRWAALCRVLPDPAAKPDRAVAHRPALQVWHHLRGALVSDARRSGGRSPFGPRDDHRLPSGNPPGWPEREALDDLTASSASAAPAVRP
jgi:hypothetical protein